MKWVNTDNSSEKVSLNEALLSNMASNGGLWLPEIIPTFDNEWLDKIDTLTNIEICCEIMNKFFQDNISTSTIKNIVRSAITFDIPFKRLDKNDYILELFHGPTLAFKDFGTRVMAEIFKHLVKAHVWRM